MEELAEPPIQVNMLDWGGIRSYELFIRTNEI